MENLEEKLKSLKQKLDEQARKIESLEENEKKILGYLERTLEKPEVSAEMPPAPASVTPKMELPPPPPPYEETLVEEALNPAKWAKKKFGGEGLDWESVFGGNWMVKIGIAALVLGAGFFLKLAFDNDWIGPNGRIVLGIIGGFLLLGAGEYWQKKYSMYAQILTGGGIAILYLTVYAAHAFYSIVESPYVAFAFMGLVTLVAGGLALRYDKPTLAIIGILGGFFTPLMFVKTVDEATLIIYTLILDTGILLLSAVRNWRPLTIAGLISSFVLYTFWQSQYYTEEKLWLAETFLTLVFVIFAFATILWHFIWKKTAKNADLLLMIANAAGYFGLSYLLLERKYDDWLGFFAFSLAVFYSVLAYFALSRAEKDFKLTLFLGGIAVGFLTIAVPIQIDAMRLSGHWITIAWAIEALVLVGTAFAIKSYQLRVAALGVLLFMAIRLVFFDTYWPRGEEFVILFNLRFLTFIISVTSIFLVAHLYYLNRQFLREEEKKVLPILLLSGAFFALWALSAEIITYFGQKIDAIRQIREPRVVPHNIDYFPPATYNDKEIRSLEYARNFSLSALWAVFSIALIVAGIVKRVKVLRIAGLALFWLTIIKVFLLDVFQIGGGYRVASLISLGIILLVTGYLYQRYKERIGEFIRGN